MQIVALVWGILAGVGMLVAFTPCLGSLNWINIPFSLLGLVLSVVSVATEKSANKGPGIAGIALCALAFILGCIRLIAGGGVL